MTQNNKTKIISVLTLFPEIIEKSLDFSILKIAAKKQLVKFNILDIRSVASDSRKSVDDKPYGGGPGMILRVDIVHKALKKLLSKNKVKRNRTNVILLDPKGDIFNQKYAENLLNYDQIVLICGHYEGFDHRITYFVDNILSIGNFVLSGGEYPALVICDAVTRLLPGVLHNQESLSEETFQNSLNYEYPQYTKPRKYLKYQVPEILMSGNHKKIQNWKKENSITIKS